MADKTPAQLAEEARAKAAEAKADPTPEQLADAAKAAAAKPAGATTGETLSVASKLPMSIVVEHGGATRLIAGAHDRDARNGFGFTHNVDADWFNRWKAENATFPPIAKDMLFTAKDRDAIEAAARERSGLATGLEGVDPDNLPAGLERVPSTSS